MLFFKMFGCNLPNNKNQNITKLLRGHVPLRMGGGCPYRLLSTKSFCLEGVSPKNTSFSLRDPKIYNIHFICTGLMAFPRQGGVGDFCEMVEDCPEMGTYCDTETNTCQVGQSGFCIVPQ